MGKIYYNIKKLFYEMGYIRRTEHFYKELLLNIVILLLIFINVLPLILLKENYIFTEVNIYDLYPGFVEMFRKHNLFFKIDYPMPAMNGLSTCYCVYLQYTAFGFLNYFLGFINAEIINHTLSVILAYLFMYVFLREIMGTYGIKSVLKLSAILYALFPTWEAISLPVATIPLIAYIFVKISKNNKKFNFKILFIVFYPFISDFFMIGFAIIGFWFISMVFVQIKEKKININLIVGFFLLLIGTVICNVKIFYYIFSGVELNRITYLKNLSIRDFIWAFINSFIYDIGTFEVPTIHYYIILPLCIFGLILLIVMNYEECFKTTNLELHKKIKEAQFVFVIIMGLFIVYSLYSGHILDGFVKVVVPFMSGFNWGRTIYLSRFFWVILFTYVLCLLATSDIRKIIACIIVFFQIVIVFFSNQETNNVYYNEVVYNIFHTYYLKNYDKITFSEHISEDYFNYIKEDIDYNNEVVISVGFYPMVLLYNGFNALDGFTSVCPIEWKAELQKVIQPQLEEDREYAKMFLENGGGICAYYNTDFVTRSKNNKPIKLLIDTKEYKELGGKYIISRMEIENYNELDLMLNKVYNDRNGIYRLFLYEVN